MTTQELPQISQKSKSIADYTPWELSQIDAYQNANRGFTDEDEEYLENWSDED